MVLLPLLRSGNIGCCPNCANATSVVDHIALKQHRLWTMLRKRNVNLEAPLKAWGVEMDFFVLRALKLPRKKIWIPKKYVDSMSCP